MTTDHEAQRTTVDDGASRSTESFGQHGQHGRHGQQALPGAGPTASSATALLTPQVDDDELEAADSFDLPGADLSSEEISVQILAAQADEFTCASCFLVRHRSQIALDRDGKLYCMDCEG